MKFQPPITVRAEVKTPLFIWDGDTISPLSFVVDGHQVHVLDSDRFFRVLAPQEQEAYLAWIEPTLDRLARLDEQLERAGKNFDLRRQLNRDKRQVAAGLSVERFLRDRLGRDAAAFVKRAGCAAYSVPWAVRPGDDGFRGFIKEAGYRPYVPGTELKGALRTSLLYTLLGQEQNYAALRHELIKFREVFRGGALPREKVRSLTKIVEQVEGKALRGAKNDAKYDLLKLVQVSDGDLLTPAALRVRALESVGTDRFTRTLAEALEPGTAFTFRLSLAAIKESRRALQELGLADLAVDNISMPRLLEASYQRSAAILEVERAYFQGQPAVLKEIDRLRAENRPDAPLLRLGTGQGFLSTTVDLRVRARDPQLYDQAIREGVSLQRRWRTQPGNFPKTRRTVSDGQRHPQTLPGWIKLAVTSAS